MLRNILCLIGTANDEVREGERTKRKTDGKSVWSIRIQFNDKYSFFSGREIFAFYFDLLLASEINSF